MHGNAVAFRSVVEDVRREDVDLIVSLGDVAQGGPQPRECVDMLRELECPCVYGNSDHFLVTLDLGAEPVEDEERRERLLDTARWSREQLGEEGLDFLSGFEPTVDVDVDDTKLVCCHATPQSSEDVILPDTPRADAERMIGNPVADVIAAGHVHLQWLRRFSNLLWFCVGSVGLVYEHKEPMDAVPFLPFCEYALFSQTGVDFRRIPFDVEELLAVARANDFPDVERYGATWRR
jgi:predicted phosphodiesterase